MKRPVDQIQRELRRWVEAHVPGLHRASPQDTLWYGVMQKCGAYVEELVRATADRLMLALGSHGDAAVKVAGEGKPLARFTLGQYMKLLQALEKPLIDFMEQNPRLAVLERPLIGRAGVRLMDRVSRLRSDFTHDRWPRDRSNELSIEFLEKAGQLCDVPIVWVAIELEGDDAA